MNPVAAACARAGSLGYRPDQIDRAPFGEPAKVAYSDGPVLPSDFRSPVGAATPRPATIYLRC